MSCPACHSLIAETALDRECPFCLTVFSRVDAARRHAKRCPQRGYRALHPGKRGRKALSCDRCSRIKVHCNARVQTPCEGCAARKLQCTFSRCCTCGDDTGQRTVDREQADSPAPQRNRDGVLPLSFLLNSTDDTQDYITERAVGKEPDGAILGPLCVTPPHARALSDEVLPDYIDPTLLLPSHGEMALFPLHPEIGGLVNAEGQDLLNALLSSRAQEDRLASRISLLESDVAAFALSHNRFFDATSFRRFFSVSNVYAFATNFCRKRHYRYPVIHWPTFALGEAPLPLLLVISLTGASYSYRPGQEPEHVNNARNLYPLADAFVFEQLSTCFNHGNDMTEAIQLCQAALLMYGLDTLLAGDAAMQHMAITQRLPTLVSAIRSLTVTDTQHTASEDWQLFLQRESIIRLVCWTFCADCLATLSCNNPPLFSLLEMTGDLPCDPELWDTDSAVGFELLRSSRPPQPSQSLRDLMAGFLENESHPDIDLQNLPLFHLHILLCAFQPVVFNLHVTLTLPSQSSKLLQVFSTWRRLWDRAMKTSPDSHRNWLGVARYVPGIEYLSRRVIEVAVSQEATSSRYLQRIPSYGTREIHEFIRDFVAKT